MAIGPGTCVHAAFFAAAVAERRTTDLRAINAALASGGHVYIGQYGGSCEAGVLTEDHYEPKHFFSRLTDGELQAHAAAVFDILDFRTINAGGEGEFHFQALTASARH